MFPSAFGYHVFADVVDIVVENAYAAIKFGGGEFLDGENVAFFEEAFGYVAEAGFAGGFFHVFAKACVGRFDDDGFA